MTDFFFSIRIALGRYDTGLGVFFIFAGHI